MVKGKLILICQSGGEFVTNEDGTLSYTGGEANASNVNYETPFDDLKLKLAETCNLDQKTVSIKYFLPGNKRNLITVKNDKDVKRMIDFHGDSITADVFVTGTAGFVGAAGNTPASRQTDTKKVETVNHGSVPSSPAYSSPAKRTRRATAKLAEETLVSADMNSEGPNDTVVSNDNDAISERSSRETTSSTPSSDHANVQANLDSGSDYVPSRSVNRKKRNGQNEIDVNATPADTVKKRRRAPSWKFGANGPTIVSGREYDSGGRKSQRKSGKTIADNSGSRKSRRISGWTASAGDNSRETKSQRKRGRSQNSVSISHDDEQELAIVHGKEDNFDQPFPLAICDDDVTPETLVATWKAAITGVGQEFKNVHGFRDALQKYAIANRFTYKFKKNDTSRAIGGCANEGCSWKIHAGWVPSSQSFKIKTLHNVHTCDEESRKSAHPTKNWLVSTIKERLKDSPHQKPKEIANGILRDFGVELNYTQAWRGLEDAREQLHGSPKESYNKLPWFCEKIVETNPGSFSKLVIKDNKRFRSLFVSFHASMCGFQNGCRPLLFLEATSLKSKFGEVLLTANAIDGNDGFFPVAFSIVDVENENNWNWFLELLKSSISHSQPITFVFDREKNLKKPVLDVFEDAHVGYSMYHLLESFKRHVKGPFHGDGKAVLPFHFLNSAQAVRLVGFKRSTEQIKQISSQAYDWVMQIEPEHWTSSSFKGERYNYISHDVGELYTKLMEESRELPILNKIDALIRMMIDFIDDARLDATMWITKLTAVKEKKLQEENVTAYGLKVLISSETLFEVREDSTHVVNLSNWDCTCLGWKETGLPCRHALAVFNLTGKSPYDYCSKYFTVDAYCLTYTESINPVPIDGPPLLINGSRVEKEERQKEEDENEEVENEEGKEEEAEKVEGSKDEAENVGGNIEVAEKEEGNNESAEKEEGIMEEAEKDVNMEAAEKEDVNMEEAEKEEGNKEAAETEEGKKGEAETEEGKNDEAETEEGKKDEAETEVGKEEEAEKEEGEKEEAEKKEGEKEEAEKEEGDKEEAEKEEGNMGEAEKGGNNEEAEKEDGNKEEAEKEQREKEEGGKEQSKKEEDDPNVLVLPPIPPKSYTHEKKEKVEWNEAEGEIRRTVTCGKCKQAGHNKKSCKANLDV